MGRVVAVALPTLGSTLDGVALTPLTEFRRDALGNVTAQIEYARGAASASATAYSVAGVNSGDRQTLSSYDSRGNVVQGRDANGVNSYASYDAQGRLRKQWQMVTGNDGASHTLFTAYKYDALGHRTATITPASTTRVNGNSVSAATATMR